MTKPMDYKYLSHEHCFNSKNPPCGLKGKHCCLCDMMTNPPHPTKTRCCIKCTGVGMLGGKCDNPSCECHQIEILNTAKPLPKEVEEEIGKAPNITDSFSPPDPLSDWESAYYDAVSVNISVANAGKDGSVEMAKQADEKFITLIRHKLSFAREQEKQRYKFMGLIYGEKLWLETGDVEIHYRALKWMDYLKERDEELTRVETARKISDLKEAIEAK